MIKITIKEHQNKIIGFEMKGHAGYADSGFDIYCSAVSVLAINCANSIESLAKKEIEASESEGYLKVMLAEEPDEFTQILFESMVLGLNETMKDNGKKYLKVNFEEV